MGQYWHDLMQWEGARYAILIVVLIFGSIVFDWARGARRGWRDWGRHRLHRARAKRRGVQMDDWQRRTGRHDGWS